MVLIPALPIRSQSNWVADYAGRLGQRRFSAINTSGGECGPPPSQACYSRSTIFQVDESAMVADLLWDTLPEYFSIWGGSINQLENGNVEFDLNSPQTPTTIASEVQEVTQTSSPQIVWQMVFLTPMHTGLTGASLYPGVTWQTTTDIAAEKIVHLGYAVILLSRAPISTERDVPASCWYQEEY